MFFRIFISQRAIDHSLSVPRRPSGISSGLKQDSVPPSIVKCTQRGIKHESKINHVLYFFKVLYCFSIINTDISYSFLGRASYKSKQKLQKQPRGPYWKIIGSSLDNTERAQRSLYKTKRRNGRYCTIRSRASLAKKIFLYTALRLKGKWQKDLKGLFLIKT